LSKAGRGSKEAGKQLRGRAWSKAVQGSGEAMHGSETPRIITSRPCKGHSLLYLRAQAGEEAVADETARARARVKRAKAGQRLAARHARHAPPLQLLIRYHAWTHTLANSAIATEHWPSSS
jgi:hypothetical protein